MERQGLMCVQGAQGPVIKGHRFFMMNYIFALKAPNDLKYRIGIENIAV